jgi:uncharacterized Zn finger protein (UPF0148 family)
MHQVGVQLCGICGHSFFQRGTLAIVCPTCSGTPRWVPIEERNPVELTTPVPGSTTRLRSRGRLSRYEAAIPRRTDA